MCFNLLKIVMYIEQSHILQKNLFYYKVIKMYLNFRYGDTFESQVLNLV